MDYFLRSTQSDWPELLALGVSLGILGTDDQGNHYGLNGAGWDYIGPVYRPTGETAIVDGVETALTAPVCDSTGTPYIHANLRLSFDLRELAQSSGDPAVAAALQSLSRFFVTDLDGNPVAPNKPARVFA